MINHTFDLFEFSLDTLFQPISSIIDFEELWIGLPFIRTLDKFAALMQCAVYFILAWQLRIELQQLELIWKLESAKFNGPPHFLAQPVWVGWMVPWVIAWAHFAIEWQPLVQVRSKILPADSLEEVLQLFVLVKQGLLNRRDFFMDAVLSVFLQIATWRSYGGLNASPQLM